MCMKLKANDEMVAVALAYDGDDLILVSKDGYCNRYSSDILADLAPRAQGVMGMNVKNDELAAVVADHHDGEELLLTTNKGGFKRIHIANLDFTSRNTKGYRLFRQIKSNPHGVSYGLTVSGYSTLLVMDSEKLQELSASEVPFMELEQSFSSPIDLKGEYFLLQKDMSDIPDVQIIDIPEGYYNNSEGDEQTSLFE